MTESHYAHSLLAGRPHADRQQVTQIRFHLDLLAHQRIDNVLAACACACGSRTLLLS